jgi:hypothetical protein
MNLALRLSQSELLDQALSARRSGIQDDPLSGLSVSPRWNPFGSKYPWHENIVTTVFWPQEASNQRSAFNPHWILNAPHENFFFFALPYTDLVDNHTTKPEAAQLVPWFRTAFISQGRSVLHGRWIQIRHGGRVVYAQWADIGPHRTDDAEYVWHCRPPLPNSNGAGLDVSPTVQQYLGMSGKDVCSWRFVDRSSRGPWLTYRDNALAIKK